MQKKFGIYLHIPFCLHKCGYCDFYSLVTDTDHPIFSRYTDALVHEIQLRLRLNSRIPVSTIFFGGGTPSLLSCDQLNTIMKTLSDHFDVQDLTEITIEINPGTVDDEKFRAYKDIGINRISIGVQAFQDHLLRRLERIHTAEQAIHVYEQARMAGFTNINLDLIFGIPGQTTAEWNDSLDRAIQLEPDHLSVYNLIYEEGTPFFQQRARGKIHSMPEEDEEKCYNLAVERLQHANYFHYEISNYCKNGMECRHNMDCWNYHPYMGFGAAAHSFDGEKRWWNSRNLHEYISNLEKDEAPSFQTEILNVDMKLQEWIFLQMRQSCGIHFAKLHDMFGFQVSNWEVLLEHYFSSIRHDLFQLGNQSLSFTAKGFWLSEAIYPQLLKIITQEG